MAVAVTPAVEAAEGSPPNILFAFAADWGRQASIYAQADGPGTPSDAPIGGGQYAFQKAGGRINQFSQQVTRLVNDGKTIEEAKQELLEMAREGYLPYPQRAIRTADYTLVINFKPDRYPLGDPYRLDGDHPPTTDEVTRVTFVTLPDEDAGPTKAWMVDHRDASQWQALFDNAYGKRPREELFDLRKDPHQMHNVASDPAYANVLVDLRERLMAELQSSGDPRVVNDGEFFETPPMAGPLPEDVPHPNRKVRR